ncbi:hypothetical protein AYO44_07195 [Planctomycetaceae bacterium SCGC AG-212-F19]|nr:hypothetical protein AYO44_07195 [Planctomycetaceae bacterium SCGC AG-212-F19]
MIARRRWEILGGMVLLIVGFFAHPAVHWRLIGWAKGEAFCQGRPTSCWLVELRRLRVFYVAGGAIISPDSKPAWAPEFFRPMLGTDFPGSELLKADPRDSVPVLRAVIQIANSDSPSDQDVRFIAEHWLHCVGLEAVYEAPKP